MAKSHLIFSATDNDGDRVTLRKLDSGKYGLVVDKADPNAAMNAVLLTDDDLALLRDRLIEEIE